MVSRGSDSLGLEREECGRHGETREGAVFTLGLWKYRVVTRILCASLGSPRRTGIESSAWPKVM